MPKLILLIAVLFQMSSCLKTRGDVYDPPMPQRSGGNASSSATDEVNRTSEINETLRELSGRIEVLENQLRTAEKNSETMRNEKDVTIKDLDRKTQLMQEELSKNEALIGQLQNELTQIKANHTSAQNSSASGTKGEKKSTSETYNQAEELFKQKDWKKAILTYQKYRDDNPKGKMLAEATYKIGVSFQELGMKDEAKTFYEEVIAKHAQSDTAKKAKFRLGQLKK